MIISAFSKNIQNLALNGIVIGGVGYLATRAFTSLNPQLGLIFGALYGASALIQINICDIFFKENPSKRIDGFNGLIRASLIVVIRTVLVAVILKQGFNINLSSKSIKTLGTIALLTPFVDHNNKISLSNSLNSFFKIIIGK